MYEIYINVVTIEKSYTISKTTKLYHSSDILHDFKAHGNLVFIKVQHQ